MRVEQPTCIYILKKKHKEAKRGPTSRGQLLALPTDENSLVIQSHHPARRFLKRVMGTRDLSLTRLTPAILCSRCTRVCVWKIDTFFLSTAEENLPRSQETVGMRQSFLRWYFKYNVTGQ